jgi:hypothetical protein
MALRPLGKNVWGVPLFVLNSMWNNSPLYRPEMSRKEKILQTIKVYGTGPECKDLSVGDLAILPEDHGGNIITVRLEDGRTQRWFCFNEDKAMGLWTGDIPGQEDTTLLDPRMY